MRSITRVETVWPTQSFLKGRMASNIVDVQLATPFNQIRLVEKWRYLNHCFNAQIPTRSEIQLQVDVFANKDFILMILGFVEECAITRHLTGI